MKAQYYAHMGSDIMVADAARVSFAKEVETFSENDVGLIKFLARHNHWTPFAHPQITLRMQAPVPIRTQCFKHKQGFVENEESRRYVSDTPEVYLPEEWRSKPEGSIKQGSADVHPESEILKSIYKANADAALQAYQSLIAGGVCPEQARFVLPQGCEVNWFWTGSLAAFARFYRQRIDPHAQKEIQVLAQEVGDIIAPLYPHSWAALTQQEK